MKPVPSTTARARGALAVLVAALVVGILGMHALATHGTSVRATAPAVAVPAAATASGMRGEMRVEMAGHRVGVGDHPSVQPARGAAADHHPGPGHDMAGMVTLCVVMLAAAALTLLALMAVRPVRRLLPAAFQPAAAYAAAARRAGGTGPPYVWQFSVIRC